MKDQTNAPVLKTIVHLKTLSNYDPLTWNSRNIPHCLVKMPFFKAKFVISTWILNWKGNKTFQLLSSSHTVKAFIQFEIKYSHLPYRLGIPYRLFSVEALKNEYLLSRPAGSFTSGFRVQEQLHVLHNEIDSIGNVGRSCVPVVVLSFDEFCSNLTDLIIHQETTGSGPKYGFILWVHPILLWRNVSTLAPGKIYQLLK